MMYRHGAGLEKSDAKALKFLTLAANSGNGPAEYDLAIMYDEGIATSVDTCSFRSSANSWPVLAGPGSFFSRKYLYAAQ